MKDIISDLFGGEAPPPRASNLAGSSEDLVLLRDRNRRIEVRYERLKLVTLAMWELLESAPRCPYCGTDNEDYDTLKAI